MNIHYLHKRFHLIFVHLLSQSRVMPEWSWKSEKKGFLKRCMLKTFSSFPIHIHVGYLTKQYYMMLKMMWLVWHFQQCMGRWHTLQKRFFSCVLLFNVPDTPRVMFKHEEEKAQKTLLWFWAIKCVSLSSKVSLILFFHEKFTMCIKLPVTQYGILNHPFCTSGHARSAIFYLLPTSLNFRSRNKEHKYKNYAISHFL